MDSEVNECEGAMGMKTRLHKAISYVNFVTIKRISTLALLLATSGCNSAVVGLRLRPWSSPETANLDGVVQTYIDPDNEEACKEDQCTFPLRYFVGGNKFFKNRKTILYISGGPGSVVNPDNRELAFLEDLDIYNVVYFDIRGASRSQLPPSNNYDKYLRAKYVTRDIEVLRQWLGIEFWDAIYAHSFGTVVAQQYAHTYGIRTTQNSTPRVLKLILSAPLARHVELEAARRSQRLNNLNSIYSQYKKNCSCPAATNTDNLKTVEDFCFLSSRQIELIKTRLAAIMKRLEDEYGSLRMVAEHYQELIDTSFAESYPFPRGFFTALSVLEIHGPTKNPARFLKGLPADQQKEAEKFLRIFNKKPFDAAFVLGYFASTDYLKFQKLREDCMGEPNCLAETKEALDGIREFIFPRFPRDFLDPETPPCLGFTRKNVHNYVEPALQTLSMSDSELSLRAYYVFGLYDGISGWLAKQTGANLDDKQAIPCVPAVAIANVSPNLVVRRHLDRIGINASESICPWNPNDYKHSVSTLLLRGDADSATAGEQAEYFFNNGLTGDRILIELKETGHNTPPILGELTALAILLKSFVNNQSIEKMLSDPKARVCDENRYYEVKGVVITGGGGCPP
jgi:pimeloyl-ACP methyl ester carboxylesterase